MAQIAFSMNGTHVFSINVTHGTLYKFNSQYSINVRHVFSITDTFGTLYE